MCHVHRVYYNSLNEIKGASPIIRGNFCTKYINCQGERAEAQTDTAVYLRRKLSVDTIIL